jgi:type IV secretory pathway VirB10-like protein
MRFTFLPQTRRERPVEDSDAESALRPAPPMAKRLNRNALTLAALIMGMTVLTAIVVLNPSKDGKPDRVTRASAEDASVVPARPAFLDEPVHSPSPNLAKAPASARDAAEQPVDHAGSGTPVEIAPLSEALTSPSSERERSYRAALASPAIVSAAPSQSARASARPPSTLETEEQQLVTLGDSVLRSTLQPSVAGASSGAPPRANSSSPRVKSRGPQSIANRTTQGVSADVAMERAGTVLPGLLITGINSELPGEIVGQISRNVYDSRTQRLLLIPRGARLIGSYDNQIAAGQGRLLVAWTRLILPDGRSMSLPGLALTDREGKAGAKDKVDNHWWRVFGNAVLLSAIGAGVQLSQPAQTSVLSTPSAGQVAAGAMGQELSNVALEILRKGMTVAPTITIRAGQAFNVFLNGDVTFDVPYEPHG